MLLSPIHCNNKAHHFNEYFVSVFTVEDMSSLGSLYLDLNICDSQTSVEEVSELLSSNYPL